MCAKGSFDKDKIQKIYDYIDEYGQQDDRGTIGDFFANAEREISGDPQDTLKSIGFSPEQKSPLLDEPFDDAIKKVRRVLRRILKD